VTPWWQLNVEARATRYGVGDCFLKKAISIDQNFTTTANTSISADILFSRAHDNSYTRASLNFNLFF